MPAIEDITAPLIILFDHGEKKLAAACFRHKLGLLYLDPFWHLAKPSEAAHIIKGKLKGDGPWRIDNATIRILGCHNTDPEIELQHEHQEWKDYLNQTSDYPSRPQILDIAQRLGAIL